MRPTKWSKSDPPPHLLGRIEESVRFRVQNKRLRTAGVGFKDP